jgi:hypothetical protein
LGDTMEEQTLALFTVLIVFVIFFSIPND